MARIRTIKPEFFTSPDTGKASPRARLLYIAMWCWADDWGVGETNLNALLGFAFPESDDIDRKEVQSLCKEVAESYGTTFYTVDGRHYYAIPAWDEHQRTQRRAERRNPTPDHPEATPDLRICEKRGTSVRTQGERKEGTGEQGNRGTGEQTLSSDADASDPGADEPQFSDDVTNLCDHLADKIRTNGNKVGTVGKTWHQSMDRLIRIDGYTPDQIRQVIDWCQHDEFWQGNILSAPKLREKFDQLKTKMLSDRTRRAQPSASQRRVENAIALGSRVTAQPTRPSLKELF